MQLLESELPLALKSLASHSPRPPPFFSHLHSHLCPSPLTRSRLRRFLTNIQFSSPTLFFYSTIRAFDHLRSPVLPRWTLTHTHRISILLAMRPLLAKRDYAVEAKEILCALCESLIREPGECMSGEEAAEILVEYAGEGGDREAVGTLLAIARAQVINSVMEVDIGRLKRVAEAVGEGLLKELVEEAVDRRTAGKQQ